jgi:hypothetical protein
MWFFLDLRIVRGNLQGSFEVDRVYDPRTLKGTNNFLVKARQQDAGVTLGVGVTLNSSCCPLVNAMRKAPAAQ